MKGFGKSDIGRIRSINEDSFYVSDKPVGKLPNLYIIADGMGGYKGGEVASSSAIKYFCEFAEGYVGEDETLDIIIEGVKYANSCIINDAMRDEDRLGGMGTTFTALVIENNRLYIAHVGDSRLYVADENFIRQVTSDHSFVMELVRAGRISPEQARNHPKKNYLTRALGVDREMLVDGIIYSIENRYVIMCSDGLTNMLTDSEIGDCLSLDADNMTKVERLIDEANRKGGSDNITVILIDNREDE